MLTQKFQLCVCGGGSLEKEMCTGVCVCVCELPPVVVVPGGVGTCVHRSTYASLEESTCCNQLH